MHDDDIESRLRAAMEEATSSVTGTGVDEKEIHETVARRRRFRRNGWLAGGVGVAAAAVAAVLLIEPGGEKIETIRPSGDRVEVTESTTSTLPDTTTTTADTTTTEAPLPEFPATVDRLEQGGTVWTVYLAVSADGSETPEMAAAKAAMADAGYRPYDQASGDGLFHCDQGAAEALGVDANVARAVFLYFETEVLAEQARTAFVAHGQPVVTVAPIQTYCAD